MELKYLLNTTGIVLINGLRVSLDLIGGDRKMAIHFGSKAVELSRRS